MKEDVKDLWLAALEGTKYRQKTGELRGPIGNGKRMRNGYCCLGVLCDIANKNKLVGLNGKPVVSDEKAEELLGHSALLPTEVLKQVGLKPEQQDVLAGFNDSGASFKVIATYIRGNL